MAGSQASFSKDLGVVEESRPDQGVTGNSGVTECAAHKDAFLTLGESAAPPPRLDPHSAVFLDVDGTLIEIAARPELVQVPREVPMLIARVSEEREGALALISGRPLAELDRLFQPWRGAAAGLHGVERRRADGTLHRVHESAAEAALDRIRPKLATLARSDSRLIFEDKGGTVALHYRAAPEREAEIGAYAEALQRDAATRLRLIVGKMVVEFQPLHVNKGLAIAAFLGERPFLGRHPVFVGDDTTDEDGFAEIRRRGGVGVRVGPPRATAATHSLPSVAAVLAWLA